MDLGIIIPCEITQRNTGTIWSHLYVESKTQTKQNKMKKDSQIQRTNWRLPEGRALGCEGNRYMGLVGGTSLQFYNK